MNEPTVFGSIDFRMNKEQFEYEKYLLEVENLKASISLSKSIRIMNRFFFVSGVLTLVFIAVTTVFSVKQYFKTDSELYLKSLNTLNKEVRLLREQQERNIDSLKKYQFAPMKK